MDKPTVFFSHSSRDKKTLARLKEIFLEKTGGSIDIFLSSDGQSIPLGKNWVYSVQEALNRAKLMIVFLTPHSVASHWTFFEAGFAYSKGIRVVPVGFLGIDLGGISPPLSLLQGFNITSKEGLNNLIGLVNDIFEHNHVLNFDDSEFADIMSLAKDSAYLPFATSMDYINEVYFRVTKEDLIATTEPILSTISDSLKHDRIEYTIAGNSVLCYGASFEVSSNPHRIDLDLWLDPIRASVFFPTLERIFQKIRNRDAGPIWMSVSMMRNVYSYSDMHRITARLHGTSVNIDDKRQLSYRNMNFRIDHSGPAHLAVSFKDNIMSYSNLLELMSILVENGVLFVVET